MKTQRWKLDRKELPHYLRSIRETGYDPYNTAGIWHDCYFV